MEFNDNVKMAIRGDDIAFSNLIEERKEILYRTAFTYVRNKDDALDIVGEAVYKAYISIKKLKEPQFFNTWLTRILINCAMDHIRKGKRIVPTETEMAINEPLGNINSAELLDLYSAIDKLDPKYKSIVILKYFQDYTLAQIADVLECPLGTVKTYLHKALKELRFELKEECL